MMLKQKFVWNLASLDVTNSSLETVIFDPKEMLGILDLRLIGDYKIKPWVLEQNLSKYYRFKSADIPCKQFNTFINTLKKEKKEEIQGKYPWLKPDERRYMSDREILDRYVDLDKLCLERKQVMDMLYKYKDTFSLRNEIGTCPNKEVETDITEKSPFYIRLYHVKDEDKNTLHKEMKRVCYLGILKEGFSAYSSPVILESTASCWNKVDQLILTRQAFADLHANATSSEREKCQTKQ